ncbi:MAG: SpoIIE family protein phosphatase, partial [Clostridia bacterium]
EGDFVVLVTDGVTDALENDGDVQLCDIISRFSGESPQRLADEILRTALAAAGGTAKDDMTVVAARLQAA